MATLQLDNELAKSLGIVVREPLEQADHCILMHIFYSPFYIFSHRNFLSISTLGIHFTVSVFLILKCTNFTILFKTFFHSLSKSECLAIRRDTLQSCISFARFNLSKWRFTFPPIEMQSMASSKVALPILESSKRKSINAFAWPFRMIVSGRSLSPLPEIVQNELLEIIKLNASYEQEGKRRAIKPNVFASFELLNFNCTNIL